MRLTKQTTIDLCDMEYKLSQLEDIEEELGIDLVTLFKALNYPIYIKEDYEGNKVNQTLWCSNRLYGKMSKLDNYFLCVDDYILYFKDYGKTWALTKEELL